MNKIKIIDYVNAIRPPLALFLLEVIAGAIISLNFNINWIVLEKLFILLISFQSLYYGIYVINDIVDYKYDKLNTRKLYRPIASGKISRKNALIFSLILIFIGFLIAFETSKILVYFETFFLTYNLIYTVYLKKIPFIDTFSGGVTHTTRVIMGFLLFGAFNYYALAVFLLLFFPSIFLIKRMKEIKYKEYVGRPIRYYSKRKIKIIWALFIPIGLFLLYISEPIEKVIIGFLLIIYILIIGLYLKSTVIRELFDKMGDY